MARAYLSSSSMRPLIKFGIPHKIMCCHSLLAFRSMGQNYMTTLPTLRPS